MKCVFEFGYLSFIALALYIIWDWIVLFLYIIKVVQIRKKMKDKQKDIFKRVNCTLYKILLLTLFCELYTVFNILLNVIGLLNDIKWMSAIIVAIDNIVVSIAIYLMVERNDNKYLKDNI